MTKLIEFQADLNHTIDTFEKNETQRGILTEHDARAITDLKQMINSAKSVSVLQQQISQAAEKLPSKLFAFLPFVNDLKKSLERVLIIPRYRIAALLVEECMGLHEENKELRTQCQQWQQKLTGSMETNFQSAQEHLANLQNTIQTLKGNLETAKSESEQAKQVYEQELGLLQNQVSYLEETCKTQKDKIEILQSEKSDIYLNYLEKVKEIETLQKDLKEEKEKPRPSVSANQPSSTYV